MLTEQQVSLIQSGFMQVIPRADAMSRIFYHRLFMIRPELRSLFPEDMTKQRGKLVSTLATIVQGLGTLDQVLPEIADLGIRHAAYNVTPEDFAPVGEALVWTLGDVLGPEWSPEAEEAWSQAYALVSGAMIAAVRKAAVA